MIRQDKLSEGTFGIVYTALSPRTNQKYAVKRNLATDDVSFMGALRELDLLNKLRDHPYIVTLEKVAFGPVFEHNCLSPLIGADRKGQKDDKVHFIFNQADCDLFDYIYNGDVKDFNNVKRFLVQMLLALEYCHDRHIIHRDIKPANMIVFKNQEDHVGNRGVVKLCDFGLAKPYTYQGIQTPNTVTSWYRAPEISLGNPNYDYKVDVWALGCTFFELISGKPFIDSEDDDDIIVSNILGKLPEALSIRQMREFVTSKRWRNVKLHNVHDNKYRKPLERQINLKQHIRSSFTKNMGDIKQFCDLLNNMLCFDWDNRYTIRQCLDHSFFSDYQEYINSARDLVVSKPIMVQRYQRIFMVDCIERKWMAQLTVDIFNTRSKCKWYSHRILFQAMDLFDRYLYVMHYSRDKSDNRVESDFRGLIHDKQETILRFMTCIYIVIKYFTSIYPAISWNAVVYPEFRTETYKAIAERFEGGLVKNCLEYNIYRDTIYEIADHDNDILNDTEIRDLLFLYSGNVHINNWLPLDLYHYYKTSLKGKPLENLLQQLV